MDQVVHHIWEYGNHAIAMFICSGSVFKLYFYFRIQFESEKKLLKIIKTLKPLRLHNIRTRNLDELSDDHAAVLRHCKRV